MLMNLDEKKQLLFSRALLAMETPWRLLPHRPPPSREIAELLCLRRQPSFENPQCWVLQQGGVRRVTWDEQGDRERLRHPLGQLRQSPFPTIQVVEGALPDSDALRILANLRGVSISFSADLSGVVIDGVGYSLSWKHAYQRMEVSWAEGLPAEWRPLFGWFDATVAEFERVLGRGEVVTHAFPHPDP